VGEKKMASFQKKKKTKQFVWMNREILSKIKVENQNR
jgi:hypothetical protein